jgi:RND family efflux transporter MFP subunit
MITQPLVMQPDVEAPAEGAPSTKPLAAGQSGHESRHRKRLRILGIAALAAIVLGGALTAGTLPRWRKQQEVDTAAMEEAAAPPRITVAIARREGVDAERVLPGNAQPLLDAAIFARTTGYLKERLVDIGDRVKEGQLLAVIAAPDVDDQLAQAKANLAQAKANLPLTEANAELAKITLKRDSLLIGTAAVAQQQVDQDVATVKSTVAQVESARATIQVNEAAVQRFTDLQGFQKIIAPFQGVITARNVDAGDLITADSPSTAREMFHLMRTDVLRVFVYVPQVFAIGIKVGQTALVYRRDDPLKQFKGKVTRTADALDPTSRTLLTEVQVPNLDNALRPGMYLQVKFIFDRNVLPVVIPAAALATRASGPRVAVLDDQHRVHYRTVELGRDFGAEIQVIAGLKPGEIVLVHPGDDLPEGTVVDPVPMPK